MRKRDKRDQHTGRFVARLGRRRMTRVVIRDDLPFRPISPDLWGIFFEDINYAADGGLYAELVQNRSFEYTDVQVPGWGPFTAWTLEGDVRLRTTHPLSEAAPHHARLGPGASIVNEGFDGISVRAGASYRFSVFARGSAGTLKVELRTADGTAATELRVGEQWSRHEAQLIAPATDPAATLALTAVEAAVDVDLVSLFPAEVFRGAPNGLRADLAETIAALRPRFVRFPGGCVAHGFGLDNMYRWPRTLGALQDRRPDFNTWGYHQSFGLGYFEYFRFCEQIAATPLPVLAAGVCCQNFPGGAQAIPDAELDDYTAEVLALIEFANGSPDTAWGARRAELGHPQPFGLRYLALGNEDEITPAFQERFARLFAAVRDRHPDVTVIGTVGPQAFGIDYERGWAFARELGVPIVDEHCYKAPKWLFENVDRYAAYDRNGPGVYLGEYGSWGNRMLNALAEAAFMTGLEANGDVVRLASYAPLLAKNGRTQWTPDLIYFDNERVLPSLNYHVQRMFATTSGDRVGQVQVQDPPVFRRPPQTFATIGLQTSGFEVDFEDISLDGTPTEAVHLTPDDGRVVLGVRTERRDYVVRVAATPRARTGGHEIGFGVHFGAVGSPDSWEWHFGTWLNRNLTAFSTADGDRDELLASIPFRLEIGRTYRIEIRVTAAGQRIEYLLDGDLVQEYVDPQIPEHRFVAGFVAAADGRNALRVVNATPQETPLELALASGRALAEARVTTLTADPAAGAPFEPAPAEPRETRLESAVLTVPPYSFTVIEWAGTLER